MRFLLGLFLALTLSVRAAENASILIYGSTPAGIAAAIGAAKDGESVLLIEPTPRIGGLLTHGLSHTDFHVFEGITGTYLDFCKRVEAYYRKTYGENSQQVKDSFRGAHGEPKVNLMIIEQMVSEQARITVKKEWVLSAVKMGGKPGQRTIQTATFTDAQGKRHIGKVVIE